jgi:hypothetical protein
VREISKDVYLGSVKVIVDSFHPIERNKKDQVPRQEKETDIEYTHIYIF